MHFPGGPAAKTQVLPIQVQPLVRKLRSHMRCREREREKETLTELMIQKLAGQPGVCPGQDYLSRPLPAEFSHVEVRGHEIKSEDNLPCRLH